MKVLITGGAGFIGSHLAAKLVRNGDTVTVLDNLTTGDVRNLEGSGVLWRDYGDVRDQPLVDRLVQHSEFVVHLAAVVGVKLALNHPAHTLDVNVGGTMNVLNAAKEHGVPVLLASSSEVYGGSMDVPFKESSPLELGPTTNPRYAYAYGKAHDESMAMAMRQEYGLAATVARFFNVAGPRQTGRYGMVIPTFVRQALRGEPITVYGSGEQTRCFGYVDDVVDAVIRLMDGCAVGQVVNIGSTEEVAIKDLARLVRELTNSDSEIVHVSMMDAYGKEFVDSARRVPDVSLLQELTGMVPSTPLSHTIRKVIVFERGRS